MQRQRSDGETGRAILATVDRFIRERLAPTATVVDDAAVFPRDLYKEFAALGIIALGVPESDGGIGPDTVTLLKISERLARESVSFAVTVSNCNDCIAPIIAGGSPELKRAWLPGLIAGDLVPAFCLSEPGGGSDVAAMTTRAERRGSDYVLTGSKLWISSAPAADIFVVFAKTDPEAGHKGISAFLVPRMTPGLVVGPPEQLLGLRSSPTAEVSFDGAVVPAASRLGEEGAGFRLAMITLDESRLHIAAVGLGAASKAVATAVEYARQRRQFGKPIIEHQGLGFIVADLATELAGCRAILANAIDVLMRGHDRKASLYAAMAKLVCSDFAMKSAVTGAQVLGGYGLSRSYPIERLIRDCKALQIFEGTNEIQRWLIARDLQRNGLVLDELDDLID